MYHLNRMEVVRVEKWMGEHLHLQNPDLRDEMLDHLCSAIEYEMVTGLTFAEAFQKTTQEFPRAEIIRAARFIHLQKYRIMYFLIPTVLLALVSIFTTFDKETAIVEMAPLVLQELDPPSGKPVADRYLNRAPNGYGMRIHPIHKKKTLHEGIDFPSKTGTPVLATGNGEVVESSFDDAYGNFIVLRHDHMYDSFYAHLSESVVEKGQKIEQGEVIGKVGNTGLSTGPHLHYEVRKNGKSIDPAPYCNP